MAAAEDMAEHAHTSDTETGFGTGLRAKLGRPPEGDAEAQASSGDEGFAPPLPAGNGVPDADVEALRGELAAALARERDLQAVVVDLEQTARSRTTDFQVDTSGRSAELDERAARLAAAETELEERERRVNEQLTMVRTEKERLSELENRVAPQDPPPRGREARAEARRREWKDATKEFERREAQSQKRASSSPPKKTKAPRREAAIDARE